MGGRTSYNQERPHDALELAVPAARYAPSPRPFPAILVPIVYPSGDAVRQVNSAGVISFRHQRYFVGRDVARQPVALRSTPDARRFTVYYCDQPIKLLDLEQPIGVSSASSIEVLPMSPNAWYLSPVRTASQDLRSG